MLIISVGGLLVLRDRPVGERTHVIDRDGRRVRTDELRARRIGTALRIAHNVPHTGELLRRKVRMSSQTFYRAVDYMWRHGLVVRCLLRNGEFPFVSYRLTRRGLDLVRRG
jgi:hypothetical protein